MKEQYEKAEFIPMSDLELNNYNGGGIPVAVFILVAAVTVAAVTFVAAGGVGWTVAVGTNVYVSTSTVTKG